MDGEPPGACGGDRTPSPPLWAAEALALKSYSILYVFRGRRIRRVLFWSSASMCAVSDLQNYISFATDRGEVQDLFGALLSVPNNTVPPE